MAATFFRLAVLEWLTLKSRKQRGALSLGFSCYYGRVMHGKRLQKKPMISRLFSLGEIDFTGYLYLPKQFEKG